MDSITEEKGLDDLLPELLSLVFGFLPIEDRKVVRLVSRKWYELCNCPAIVKNEKFLFSNRGGLVDVDVRLQNCEYVRPTIEFNGCLDPTQYPVASTWQRMGEKIYSVSVINCRIPSDVVGAIFLYCPNLHTFESSFVGTEQSRLWKNDEMMRDSAMMMLFGSLENSPKLVKLCTHYAVELKMSEFFNALRMVSSSKLESFLLMFTLKLDADEGVPAGDLTDRLTALANNETLQTLILECIIDVEMNMSFIPEDYCSSILTHFCNLRHLEIGVESDKVLQTIFQYHIHLHTLILYGLCNCTTFGFTGLKKYSSYSEEIGYSISRLSELMYLDLEVYLSEPDWIDSMLQEFNFPRLEYFRLHTLPVRTQPVRTKEVSINRLSTAVPSLRVLVLETVRVSMDQLLDVCKHLPALKTLYYDSVPLDDPTLPFIAQPSLMYFAYSSSSAYVYDRSTKDIGRIRLHESSSIFHEFLSRVPCWWAE